MKEGHKLNSEVLCCFDIKSYQNECYLVSNLDSLGSITSVLALDNFFIIIVILSG
jgi:hypothetical protein